MVCLNGAAIHDAEFLMIHKKMTGMIVYLSFWFPAFGLNEVNSSAYVDLVRKI